jgi:hypothetical protein
MQMHYLPIRYALMGRLVVWVELPDADRLHEAHELQYLVWGEMSSPYLPCEAWGWFAFLGPDNQPIAVERPYGEIGGFRGQYASPDLETYEHILTS